MVDPLRLVLPYLAEIRQAALEFGRDPAVLAAVGLRETWLGTSPGYFPRGTHLGFGDGGYGFGLFQADFRTKQSLIASGELDSPLGQARAAARELQANRRLLGKVFPQLPASLIDRAAVCAYNATLGKVAAQLYAGADPDAVTTKGPTGMPDYGSDVMARAESLRRRDPVNFPPPAG